MDGEVDPGTVEALLSEREAGPGTGLRIVDVRSPRGFAEGHLPGSECIPLTRLAGEVEALDGAERVITVCPHGEASVQAARLVGAYGGLADDATVESMAGGLTAWEGPLEVGESAGDDSPDGSGAPDAPF